jgi:hypothetical protein
VRFALKIKALIILFAWLIILAHNIIPHNHQQEQHSFCNSLFHSVCINDHSHESEGSIINSGNEEEKVCHFSNNLFHHFNADNLLLLSDRTSHITEAPLTGVIAYNYFAPSFTDAFYVTASLRGPPLS